MPPELDDDHVAAIREVLIDHGVRFVVSFRCELVAVAVHEMDVVMGLGPVIAHKHFHHVPP